MHMRTYCRGRCEDTFPGPWMDGCGVFTSAKRVCCGVYNRPTADQVAHRLESRSAPDYRSEACLAAVTIDRLAWRARGWDSGFPDSNCVVGLAVRDDGQGTGEERQRGD
jgi:hypothetical protein